jgi:hypothetical protein
VHFKSNRGDATSNIGKREEAARQLLTHVAEMESAYSESANVVTIIAGDFNRSHGRPIRNKANLLVAEGEVCLVLRKCPAI